MGRRVDLHELLVAAVGSRHVYFQPPSGYQLSYPCIVYEREKIGTLFANNRPFCHSNRYSVTVIDQDPESPIPGRIAEFPMCVHDRQFVSDNLYHDVFTLYY